MRCFARRSMVSESKAWRRAHAGESFICSSLIQPRCTTRKAAAQYHSCFRIFLSNRVLPAARLTERECSTERSINGAQSPTPTGMMSRCTFLSSNGFKHIACVSYPFSFSYAMACGWLLHSTRNPNEKKQLLPIVLPSVVCVPSARETVVRSICHWCSFMFL